MSEEARRFAYLWRALLDRFPQAAEVLEEAGSAIDARKDPDIALLRAFDILFDERKERLFRESLKQAKGGRRRIPTPMAERPAKKP